MRDRVTARQVSTGRTQQPAHREPQPRTAPCTVIASAAYALQLGSKRQDGGRKGEIALR